MTSKTQEIEGGRREGFFTSESASGLVQLRLCPAGHNRKGLDGLGAVCRQRLGDNPLEGAVYVFRNRAGTALKLLLYDGQGYWVMMKRLSTGRFAWWPTSTEARVPLSARELMILIWHGDPDRIQMAKDWRRVASGEARLRA